MNAVHIQYRLSNNTDLKHTHSSNLITQEQDIKLLHDETCPYCTSHLIQFLHVKRLIQVQTGVLILSGGGVSELLKETLQEKNTFSTTDHLVMEEQLFASQLVTHLKLLLAGSHIDISAPDHQSLSCTLLAAGRCVSRRLEVNTLYSVSHFYYSFNVIFVN